MINKKKQNLERLLNDVSQEFKVHFEPIKIGDIKVNLLQISDLDRYIEQVVEQSEGGKIELPFWARIWPTSILLGYYLLKLPPRVESKPKILEIGAGVGLCGLVAAKLGFEVTISDINPQALSFAQINILENELEDLASTRRVDFCKDHLDDKYDIIIGSEILYFEDSYRPLVKFFKRHLKSAPNVQVVLAKGYKLKAKKFFKLAEKEFDIQEKLIGYKEKSPTTGEEERHLCQIYRLAPK